MMKYIARLEKKVPMATSIRRARNRPAVELPLVRIELSVQRHVALHLLDVIARFGALQTALTNDNTYSRYGTSYDGATWTAAGN